MIVGSTPTYGTKKNNMKTIKVDNVNVVCTEDGLFYCCYIVEHDMYFSAKIGDYDMIERKTRAMIKSMENFLREYPEYIR